MNNKISDNEQKILDFWKKNKIFEKSVTLRPESKPYVFYDGPPFATGLPHYGHIVASVMKDVVPRYWTMKGFRVERKWGWDCHGLPIENIIESELGLKSKRDILKYGVTKFNNACHATVLKYAKEWKMVIDRLGRWIDMENDYKTMDLEYMESVWWVFGELWKKGLVYEGHKAMHICPRCETPLSNFEVTQGYKDVKDISVIVKFKITNNKLQISNNKPVFILAWTTTPWTLPGNVLLAVGKNIKYAILDCEEELLIVATDRLLSVMKDKKYTINKEINGKGLVGLEYEPLFPYFSDTKNAFKVVYGDFVSTEDGTGVVHIAPAFGEDDYNLGKDHQVGWVQHIGMDGRFIKEVKDFAEMEVKPKDDPTKTDIEIIKWLSAHGNLFSKAKYEHSYPHCWRCDSPLLNYATSSWFIRVTKLKKDLLANNKKIHWVPEHIKEGRFGKWLEGARDWAVSRSRFWGAPLPIWKSEDGDIICIGSVKELEKLTGEKFSDIHKHIVDKVIIKKDSKEYRRVPDVFDCWFESGSMPYGQMHYPFENKKKFELSFPAEFIAEGQDQTRGWFYTLHILATALTREKEKSIPLKTTVPAFKNVIVNGIVLAEDGKKMSKRLKNYPDPMEIINKYGADALRYYLMSSAVAHGENLNFSETETREYYNKFINTLKNCAELYFSYHTKTLPTEKSNPLDQWILTRLEETLSLVDENMTQYKLAEACRPLLDFITDLSQWHIRRSRDRIKDKESGVIETLGYVFLRLSKIIAPFTPFIAEDIYSKLDIKNKKESVHLTDWPKHKPISSKQKKLLADMTQVRNIVELALSLRAENSLKVRQPLRELQITNCKLDKKLLAIIAEELNVKKVNCKTETAKGDGWAIKDGNKFKIALNILITEELKREGWIREIVRAINALRKKANLTPNDKVEVYMEIKDNGIKKVLQDFKNDFAKSTSSKEIIFERKKVKNEEDIKIEGKNIWIGI